MREGEDKIPTGVKYAIGGLALVLGGYGLYRYNATAEERKRNELFKKATWTPPKNKPNILVGGKVAPGTPINLAQIAGDIYASFYEQSGGTEDEERAIRAFYRTPFLAVKPLTDFYFKLYGKNLYDDFAKYLDDVQFSRVKFYFR